MMILSVSLSLLPFAILGVNSYNMGGPQRLACSDFGWIQGPEDMGCIFEQEKNLNHHDSILGCYPGHLVEIKSATQQQFIDEGSWYWESNKEPLGYTNWGPGEPNNYNGEDCAEARFSGGRNIWWNDVSCDSIGYSICQIN